MKGQRLRQSKQSLLDASDQITATNFNVVLGIHKGLFSLSPFLHDFAGKGEHVEYQQNGICCFRDNYTVSLKRVSF